MTERVVLQFIVKTTTTSAFITVVKMVSVRFSDWNSTRLGSSSRICDTTLSNERLNTKYAKPHITRQRTQHPIQKNSGRYLRTLFLALIDSFDTKQVHHSPFISKPLSSCFSAFSFIVSTHYDKRITAVLGEHVDGNMLSGINSCLREPWESLGETLTMWLGINKQEQIIWKLMKCLPPFACDERLETISI